MIKEIGAMETLELIRCGRGILIDVREADEFAMSHIPYALSVPMSVFDTTFHNLYFPEEVALIILCKAGVRSAKVCEYIQAIPNVSNTVYNLSGGIIAWKESGLITL